MKANNSTRSVEHKAVRLRVSTTPQVKEYLRQLVDTGLFGNTIEEVAERLIAERIRNILRGENSSTHKS